MMETVFNLIYVLCDLLAIGFGAKALLWLLSGELRHKSAVLFLRSVLAASIIGLFFPSHHLPSSHGISMLSVYVSGASILAWRKFHLVGIWYSVFALSTTVILYLSVLVAIAQVLRTSSPFTALGLLAQSSSILALTQYIVIAFFTVLGVLAVKGRAKKTAAGEQK